MSDEPELLADDFELPEPRSGRTSRPSQVSELRPTGTPRRAESLDDQIQQEKDQILEALTSCNWNRAKAAKLIGMPRRTFYRRLKKYGIQ